MRRLQVGCGPLAAIGWDQFDVEYPTDWVSFEEGIYETGSFWLGNVMSDVAAGLDTYDRVEMHHVLSGFTWEDGQRAVSNCYGWVKPGGVFRLSDLDMRRLVQMWIGRHTDRLPTADQFKLEDERLCRMVFYNEWRRSIYTAATACKLLEDCGFVKVRCGHHGESGLDSRPEESFYVEGVK